MHNIYKIQFKRKKIVKMHAKFSTEISQTTKEEHIKPLTQHL